MPTISSVAAGTTLVTGFTYIGPTKNSVIKSMGGGLLSSPFTLTP